MNNALLHLPVYEPAGHDLRLTEADLLQHLLVLGATGSGKTSLLHRVVGQLIAYGSRPGLLVCDAKADDTVARVARRAVQAGRAADLVVLGPAGTHGYDLFAPLRSLADVEPMRRRLLAGVTSVGRDNRYWEELRVALLEAALSFLVLQGPPIRFDAAIAFLREWCFDPGGEAVDHGLQQVLARMDDFTPVERRQLTQAVDTVLLWRALDPRTRSIAQTTLLTALRPLTTAAAAQCFAAGERPLFAAARIADVGGLCVVSVNALTEPGLAELLFKVVKHDFLRAVQQRGAGEHRLCGLIADEFPLLADPDDVDTLATVRARRCFVAAASQGLSVLDERLGVRLRKALLGNFGTLVFLRLREEETDDFASVHLGWREEVSPAADGAGEAGSLLTHPWPPRRPTRRQRVLVCPPGTLGQLPPHHAYLAAPNRKPTAWPLHLVPWFED